MKNQKGSIIPAILVISGAFIIAIYGLILVLTSQLDFSHRQIGSEISLNIAEAGINYYRWHLAHAPSDFTDGDSGPGPYVHVYTDPQGDEVGEYSLEITAPSNGSSLVTIKSTGHSYRFPSIKRTVTAQYGKASFARHSFLVNGSLWFGTGAIVYGDIHSNNGIRMDGTNTGIVSSSREDYQCGSETGCSPPTKMPGVWGAGGDKALWQFPNPSIDFDSVSVDFTTMKQSAQSNGLYLPSSNRSGYHIIFSDNGTFIVRRVDQVNSILAYRVPGEGLGAQGQGGCRQRDLIINSESQIGGTYNVSDVPIIFAEDNLWVEGTVRGRTTVVAAGFPVSSSLKNIVINNNIQYTVMDGADALGLIAQNDLLFNRDLPNDFRIDGVIMAQKGQVIRQGFLNNCGHTATSVRNSLTINGAIISYNKSYWNYGTGPESGFINRTINYDGHLFYSPPPYFPTYSEYEFVSWSEN